MKGPTRPPSVVVLLSGGIDSCACVQYYLEQGFDASGVFVDYGQAASKPEGHSARAVATHFGIELHEVVCATAQEFQAGEVSGRNAFLVMAAYLWAPFRVGTIALGIHSGTRYYDCSKSFVEAINVLLDGYSDGRVKCEAPFLDWDKGMIFDYCVLRSLPIDITYSCEAGTTPPCGKCLSCKDRRELDARSAR